MDYWCHCQWSDIWAVLLTIESWWSHDEGSSVDKTLTNLLPALSRPTLVGSSEAQGTAPQAQSQAALPSRLSSRPSSPLPSTPWHRPSPQQRLSSILLCHLAMLTSTEGSVAWELNWWVGCKAGSSSSSISDAQAAYGQGLPAAAGYPATHPGIPAPTVAGPTNTTQFQKQAYGSR